MSFCFSWKPYFLKDKWHMKATCKMTQRVWSLQYANAINVVNGYKSHQFFRQSTKSFIVIMDKHSRKKLRSLSALVYCMCKLVVPPDSLNGCRRLTNTARRQVFRFYSLTGAVGGVEERRNWGHMKKTGRKSVTASEKRKVGDDGKLRDGLVKQVCHRWRNKKESATWSRAEWWKEWETQVRGNGEKNKNAHQCRSLHHQWLMKHTISNFTMWENNC